MTPIKNKIIKAHLKWYSQFERSPSDAPVEIYTQSKREDEET